MKTTLLFYACMLIAAATSAQCANPGAHVAWLRDSRHTKDTLLPGVKSDLAFIQFQKHDTVADVGTYDGFYPLLYSIFSDSVVFYLNDITETGFSHFDTIKGICTELRGAPMTNTFKLVKGNDSCTNLPRHLFTKVMLQDALHHFKLIDKMLAEIKEIMSPEPTSRLLLYEPIRTEPNQANLCRGAMYRDELIRLMKRNGFVLVREYPRNDWLGWFEFEIKRE